MSKKPGEKIWENPNAEQQLKDAIAEARRQKEYAERAASNRRSAPTRGGGAARPGRAAEAHIQLNHSAVIDVDAIGKDKKTQNKTNSLRFPESLDSISLFGTRMLHALLRHKIAALARLYTLRITH